jgi:hypothetical protein
MNTLTPNKGIVELFTILDDLNALLQLSPQITGRPASLCLSEAATISLIRSEYGVRTWKGTYRLIKDRFPTEFRLPEYKNFVLLMNKYARALMILLNILLWFNRQQAGVIKLVDSTPLPVCMNRRIHRHKTMRSVASRSKTSTGWFYGLKLHVVSDLTGNLLMIRFTTGNVDDRVVLNRILEKITRSIFIADAGYLSTKLQTKAQQTGNLLFTSLRKNMKKLASHLDICLLNLRPRIETLFSVLKERLGLVTTLPRSINGYIAHYIHVIFGYVVRKVVS